MYFTEINDPQQTRACSIPENIKINVEVTNEEVLSVIKTLKNKSPGKVHITNEIIKYGGEKIVCRNS